jgi:hypothetical protein
LIGAADLIASHGISVLTSGDDEASTFAGISYVSARRQ